MTDPEDSKMLREYRTTSTAQVTSADWASVIDSIEYGYGDVEEEAEEVEEAQDAWPDHLPGDQVLHELLSFSSKHQQ